jgi:hypothetical protein
METHTAVALLVGYRRGQSVVYLVVAATVAALAFAVAAAVWAGVGVFGFERFREVGPQLVLGICALAAGLAGLHGYANDGVLVGTAIAFAPFAGVLVWGAVATELTLPSPGAGQAGLDRLALLGAAAGVVLTALGTGVGRLVSSDPERNVNREPPAGEG